MMDLATRVDPKYDRAIGLGISLLTHVVLISLWWPWQGSEGRSVSGIDGEGVALMTVEFVEVPRAERLPTPPMQSPGAVSSGLSAPPLSKPAATLTSPTIDGEQPLAGQVSENKPPQIPHSTPASADTTVQSLATQSSGSQGATGSEDGLRARYIAAIRQAIAQRWTPDNHQARCTLVIKQTPGGHIETASSESCDLDDASRRALEAASLMAQPLPYAGFEPVFSEEISLQFGRE